MSPPPASSPGLRPKALRALLGHLHASFTPESDWFDTISEMPSPPPQPLLSALACSDPGLCPSPQWSTVTAMLAEEPTSQAVGLLLSACRSAHRLWLLCLCLATVVAAAVVAVAWVLPGLSPVLWTPPAAAVWAWWCVPRLRPSPALGSLLNELAAADVPARPATLRHWVRVRSVLAVASAGAAVAFCAAVFTAVLASQSG